MVTWDQPDCTKLGFVIEDVFKVSCNVSRSQEKQVYLVMLGCSRLQDRHKDFVLVNFTE